MSSGTRKGRAMEPQNGSRKRRERAHAAAAGQHSGRQRVARRLRIMLVKDIPAVNGPLGELLEQAGHQVRVVADCHYALQEVQHFKPHIIFTDISLPDIDTYALGGKLRGEGLQDIVLVAVSRYSGAAYEGHILQRGFDYHLTAPVEPQEVEPLIRSAVAGLA